MYGIVRNLEQGYWQRKRDGNENYKKADFGVYDPIVGLDVEQADQVVKPVS